MDEKISPYQPPPVPERSAEKPPKLPSWLAFEMKLLRLRTTKTTEERPPLPENPLASDLAAHAKIDWDHINTKGEYEGTGRSLGRSLYSMAKLMMTREGYSGQTASGEYVDPSVNTMGYSNDYSMRHRWIGINPDWSIGVAGNHRALVLRILGREFVEKSGMNEWVKVWKLEAQRNNPSPPARK